MTYLHLRRRNQIVLMSLSGLKIMLRDFPGGQWLRIHRLVQGMWIWPLHMQLRSHHRATKPLSLNYGVCVPQLERSPYTATKILHAAIKDPMQPETNLFKNKIKIMLNNDWALIWHTLNSKHFGDITGFHSCRRSIITPILQNRRLSLAG